MPMAALPWNLIDGFSYAEGPLVRTQLANGNCNVVGERVVVAAEDLARWPHGEGVLRQCSPLPIGPVERKEMCVNTDRKVKESTVRRDEVPPVAVYRDPLVSVFDRDRVLFLQCGVHVQFVMLW